eukprot:2536241-Pyramimonas_sp.AAC.1
MLCAGSAGPARVSGDSGRTKLGQGICEVVVSDESGLKRSTIGVSEATVSRMSQAKAVGPPWGRAPPKSGVRGRPGRKLSEHHIPGNIGGQTISRLGTSPP